MTAKEIIEKMGGRSKVMEMTGIKRSRISQYITQNHIPKHWLILFHEKDNTIPLKLNAK